MNKFNISLKDLRSCPGQKLYLPYTESINGQELDGPVEADIYLAANSTSVRLSGQIHAAATLSCHRCLNSFLHPMVIDLDEEFVYEDYLNTKAARGKERELLKEDFFETVAYDGAIDISDIVYQAIVLAIPNHCLCGPNCAGAPIYKGNNGAKTEKTSTGGAERQPFGDPRWHNLKTIFSNDTQNDKVRDNNA